MRKVLLTTFVILFSHSSAHAVSSSGRVKMTVIRTNVQPADINIVQSQQVTKVAGQSDSDLIEIVY